MISDPDSKTLSFTSRLGSIWRFVREKRRSFEQIPDKGLIGKSVQRFFNRIWLYLIVGFFGTLSLSLIFPPLCIVTSTLSLCFGLLSPVWYPVLSLIQHLAFILIYDWDFSYYSYHQPIRR